jgi:hypothetical protein
METELPATQSPVPPPTDRPTQRRANRRRVTDARPIQHRDVGLVELYLAQLRHKAGWSPRR